MATYYTDGQKDEIRRWLLELREIVNPNDFMSHRERASELVRRLDQCNFERTSTMDDEFRRVRRIWAGWKMRSVGKGRNPARRNRARRF